MDRSQAILLVLILHLECKGQDLCNGNYMAIAPIRVRNDFSLVCNCPSSATTVAWFKDNNQTAMLANSDSFTVHVVSAGDGGYYRCHCDAHSRCFLLKVHNRITRCQVLPTPVPIGGTMTIHCGAEGYPFPRTCHVIVPGLVKQLDIVLNGSLGTITHPNVALNNTGIYTCFVNDESGYDEQQVTVNTYEQPKILRFNYTLAQKSAVLTCSISYNFISITLLHGNTSLYANQTIMEHPHENSSMDTKKYTIQISEQTNGSVEYILTIHEFSPDDTGQYTCQVGSLYESIEQQCAINVTAFFPNDTTTTPFTATTPGDNATSNTATTVPIATIAAAAAGGTCFVFLCIAVTLVVVILLVKKKRKRARIPTSQGQDIKVEMKDIEQST